MKTSIRILFLTGILLATVTLAWRQTPALASPLYQLTPFPTPTPGPDGRILYTVQAGDTLLRISLISGVSVDELRGLNNIVGDNIQQGQTLLLGLGGPSQTSPTPGPAPTKAPVTATPTAKPGVGTLCILLFDDLNGDSLREEEEPSIAGGAISISSRSGSISETVDTQSGSEPQCFENLGEGEYTVTVGVPSGYNPTTVTNATLNLRAGDTTYMDFGAQANTVTLAAEPAPVVSEERSPVLGIIGGVLLLGGVIVGVFATRMIRAR
jgi:murein DD-endopeptidase MepM/ murein hydrolase activator NlpD